MTSAALDATKRVLVLGGSGMLGHKAFQALSERFATWATFRRLGDAERATGIFPSASVIEGVDAARMDTVERAIATVRPNVVLNGIGIVKQDTASSDPRQSIYVNALFPHLLASVCRSAGARLIHVSTDCVFSGDRGNYRESDPPDAQDLYGRTKLLGELPDEHTLTLRTSIIGRELFGSRALVGWLLSRRGGHVRGFTNAVFSGLTTRVLSTEIGRLISDFPALSGVYHVSASAIDKYRLLRLIRDAYQVEIDIEPFDDFHCDRTLVSDRYRLVTGFEAPSWTAMVADMAADPTPYDRLRTPVG